MTLRIFLHQMRFVLLRICSFIRPCSLLTRTLFESYRQHLKQTFALYVNNHRYLFINKYTVTIQGYDILLEIQFEWHGSHMAPY